MHTLHTQTHAAQNDSLIVLRDSAVGDAPGGATGPANVTLSVRGGLPPAAAMLTVRCSTRSDALRASASGPAEGGREDDEGRAAAADTTAASSPSCAAPPATAGSAGDDMLK